MEELIKLVKTLLANGTSAEEIKKAVNVACGEREEKKEELDEDKIAGLFGLKRFID